ncbi:helix-turn-helix domain-containing protein [Ruminiclostridium cellulolyticum]|uniref:Transcriptional regulator, AraC family n=1 Tax=Ruminiclostridium cellulolyticum (strain ATCC 35319 / DSM 5812 / JCM 6584 / H10) TaxID=394503 RepID=B8I3L9_RUMCH|nr:helix-turn-helix domain-containing protein [Ruminiclostridium cellulolyticum]ACL76362.1 transcriptional regulator, AraC family [Ruminiclostridium cellulolyticum H10]
MFKLNNIYRPITAQPFLNDESYTEIQPCEALKPYICCFWGTQKPYSSFTSTEIKDKLVIPDTCMDIVFNTNMDKNELDGFFAGVSDTTFIDKTKNVTSSTSCFAIRFYCWAVPLFSDESMKNVLNSFVVVEDYFKNFKRDLYDILISNQLFLNRVDKVQQYLINKINLDKQNANIMNSVYKILKSKGTVNISELAGFTAVSQRQLERLFLEYVGVSPKKLSGLVRYQYLWQDILYNTNLNIHDSVCKYGYTDQSHLLKDFKKYHTLSTVDARIFAYKTR